MKMVPNPEKSMSDLESAYFSYTGTGLIYLVLFSIKICCTVLLVLHVSRTEISLCLTLPIQTIIL